MKNYDLFLIDLDGTIYRGTETIESGVRFVKRLIEAKKDYLFLTNNTTRTPQMVVDKLQTHGIYTDIQHIYTASMATASYLKKISHKDYPSVYIIGETGLWTELVNQAHFELDENNPDYVVVGMDTDLTYHKLRVATKAIRNGATFIGTNADMNLPLGNELVPGNGSQCVMLAAATGKQPLYVGKPEAIVINLVLERLKKAKASTLIVGDNYNTDIKAGFNSGVDQLLTLTGITKKGELIGKRQPTIVVNNLDEYIL